MNKTINKINKNESTRVIPPLPFWEGSGVRLLLLLSLCVSLSAFGQKTYTLNECREMALRNNVAVRNAANNVEAARQERKEAFTKYFPTVSASGAAFNANKGLLQMDMSPDMQMSLAKNGIMGGITATQPVFAGGQIFNANKLAKVGEEASRYQQEQSKNEVELTVEQYYWQVVTLKEKRKTLLLLQEMLERLHRDVEVAVSAGVTNRNDLLQVQLKKNDVESNFVNLENGLALSKMVLAQYMGCEGEEVDVEDAAFSSGEVPAFPMELRRDHEASLALTPEYRLLQSNVKASQLQKRLAVGKNLPTVAVGAGYMYDDLMDHSHPFALGFVSVSVPLSGWWGGSHAIKKQKFQLRNAENQLADNSELLVIRMQKAWNDLEDAYKQILIARSSIEQSTENLRLNEDYYRAGTTTMSDLLDAQTLFRQSHDKYVEAYSLYNLKILEYRQATGQ